MSKKPPAQDRSLAWKPYIDMKQQSNERTIAVMCRLMVGESTCAAAYYHDSILYLSTNDQEMSAQAKNNLNIFSEIAAAIEFNAIESENILSVLTNARTRQLFSIAVQNPEYSRFILKREFDISHKITDLKAPSSGLSDGDRQILHYYEKAWKSYLQDPTNKTNLADFINQSQAIHDHRSPTLLQEMSQYTPQHYAMNDIQIVIDGLAASPELRRTLISKNYRDVENPQRLHAEMNLVPVVVALRGNSTSSVPTSRQCCTQCFGVMKKTEIRTVGTHNKQYGGWKPWDFDHNTQAWDIIISAGRLTQARTMLETLFSDSTIRDRGMKPDAYGAFSDSFAAFSEAPTNIQSKPSPEMILARKRHQDTLRALDLDTKKARAKSEYQQDMQQLDKKRAQRASLSTEHDVLKQVVHGLKTKALVAEKTWIEMDLQLNNDEINALRTKNSALQQLGKVAEDQVNSNNDRIRALTQSAMALTQDLEDTKSKIEKRTRLNAVYKEISALENELNNDEASLKSKYRQNIKKQRDQAKRDYQTEKQSIIDSFSLPSAAQGNEEAKRPKAPEDKSEPPAKGEPPPLNMHLFEEPSQQTDMPPHTRQPKRGPINNLPFSSIADIAPFPGPPQPAMRPQFTNMKDPSVGVNPSPTPVRPQPVPMMTPPGSTSSALPLSGPPSAMTPQPTPPHTNVPGRIVPPTPTSFVRSPEEHRIWEKYQNKLQELNKEEALASWIMTAKRHH